MNQDTINFWLGIWGAATGTVALLIEYFAFQRDRAKLRVRAEMAFGSDIRHGTNNEHFLTVTLTNTGRGIIRIRRFSLSRHSMRKYYWIRLLNVFRRYHNRTQEEFGIYNGSTDPIDEIFSNPNIKTYPPKTIILEDYETKEIRVGLVSEALSIMPTPNAILIVTDHLGRKHFARFMSFHMKQSEKT